MAFLIYIMSIQIRFDTAFWNDGLKKLSWPVKLQRLDMNAL